jgi:hypothetical protein
MDQNKWLTIDELDEWMKQHRSVVLKSQKEGI